MEPDESIFEYTSNKGWRFTGDGRSVFLSDISISELGYRSNYQALFEYSSALQSFKDSMNGLKDQDYTSNCIFRERDFQNCSQKYAYKFVTKQTYEQFISKGSFLVSSLERYRTFEERGDPAGDRFEGRAHSVYYVAGRELTVFTLSGFDTHIFSLARDLRNISEMKDKFGEIVLRIELRPFARSLSRLLGKGLAKIRLVRYADLKLYRGVLSLADVEGFPPHLTARLAKALRRQGRLPAIFSKPSRFSAEREVRIAIEMSSDVANFTVVEDQNLLKFVERIDL